MANKVRVFCACSLDGFIAGPDDDLSWLPQPSEDEMSGDSNDSFSELMSEVGCLLMGRNSYQIPAAWDGPWPYGSTPVHVATSQPLEPKVPSVRAVQGDIDDLVRDGLDVARGKDLYIDGGQIIRQALDAGLVDQMDLTLVPIVLSAGVSLFSGVSTRRDFEFIREKRVPPGLLQITLLAQR